VLKVGVKYATEESAEDALPKEEHSASKASARTERGPSVVELEKPESDAASFLASAGLRRRIVKLVPRETFFSQGDPADSVFISRWAVQKS
jgi:hypothetical protein